MNYFGDLTLQMEKKREAEKQREQLRAKTSMQIIESAITDFREFVNQLECKEKDEKVENRFIFKTDNDKYFDDTMDEGFQLFDAIEKAIEEQTDEITTDIVEEMGMTFFKRYTAFREVIGKEAGYADGESYIDREEIFDKVHKALWKKYEHISISSDWDDTELYFTI